MLHLQELYLDGWMSYVDLLLRLDSPGTTLIRGPIGSGKSGILEAIFYLNFGKTIRDKDSVNDLINKITNNGYEIWIKQSIGINHYLIREIRDRKGKGLYFEKNGKAKSGKSDPETRKLINSEWNMSPEDFKSIAFLGQKQSQDLVEGKPADRARAIVDIYGLSKYDLSIASCDSDMRSANKDVEILKNILEKNKLDLSSLEDNLVDTIYDDENLHKDLEKTNSIIETLECKLDKMRQSTQELYAAVSSLESKKRSIERIKEIKEEIKELSSSLSNYSTEEDHSAVQEELNSLRNRISVVESKIGEANDKIQKAVKIKNECPINNEDCPVHIPKKYKSKILKEASEEKEKYESNLSSLEKKSIKYKGRLEACRSRDSIIQTIEKKESIISNIDSVVVNEKDLQDKQEKLEKLNSKIVLGKENLSIARDRQLNITKKLSEIKTRKDLQKRVQLALKEKKEAIEELKENILVQTEELKYMTAALAIFKKMKMYKIDLVLKTLNENIKDVLNNISDGEYKAEFVSQKLSADKKKTLDKVGIIVHDSYKSMPIELWSGGQVIEVALAVLLSVWKTSHTLSNKGVTSLWLDEVFGPLDENIINRVFDAVKTTAEELGASSIKIISHRDLDERLFDHVWEVSQENGITKLEELQCGS
jgi:DNA repair exonuclease SbcCD ATPase subunit